MSAINSLAGQASLQYLQSPQANGQPKTPAPAAGGNDHDGDEVGGVDVGSEKTEGSRVNIKA